MAHITLSIPDELYEIIKEHREINWSEIARRAIIREILRIKAMKGELTREEFLLLQKLTCRRVTENVIFDIEKEREFLKSIRDREKKRVER